MSEPTAAPAQPVPTTDEPYGFGPLVASAYRGLFGHFGDFLKAAALPLLLSVLLQALLMRDLAALLGEALKSSGSTQLALALSFRESAQSYMWLELAVGMLTSVVFAVAWHRFMLGHGRPPILPALSGRHVHFFFLSILLALPLFAGVFIGGMAGMALAGPLAVVPVIGFGLLGYYVSLRLNLCLPAAAVGESAVGPAASWDAMRGRVLALFFASLACVLPLGAGLAVMQLVTQPWIEGYLMSGRGFELVLAVQVASNLLALMIAALGVGALSQALRSLIPDPRRV